MFKPTALKGKKGSVVVLMFNHISYLFFRDMINMKTLKAEQNQPFMEDK